MNLNNQNGTMSRYLRYFWTLLSLSFITGCSLAELDNGLREGESSTKVTIVGRITNFKDCDVTTRGPKEGNESKIHKMTMAIFPVNEEGNGFRGNCVYYSPNKTSSSFTIDRSNFGPGRYAIYVFANIDMPEISDITGLELSTLLAQSRTGINSVELPEENGFPMIGSLGDTFSTEFDKDDKVFILCPTVNNELQDPTVDGTPMPLLQIPMKALYAKVNFKIEVAPNAIIDGNNFPQFTLESYQVNNVPTQVSYSVSKNNYDLEESDKSLNTLPLTGTLAGGNIAGGASRSIIEFTFYLPERLLAPVTSSDEYTGYPFDKNLNLGLELDKNQNGYHDESQDTKLQRYKPRLLDNPDKTTMKPATNVVISGQYRDHQNHYWDVSYTIYLGEDNYSDFNILRNKEYNNIVSIKGIETSSENILVDHRVNIDYSQPAKITLLREVLLDSHFEVRPLRVKLNNIGDVDGINAVKVQVVDPNQNGTNVPNWMRIERSFGDGTPEGAPQTTVNGEDMSIYIDEDSTSPSYGKRRFFTYNLIDGVNATQVDATLKNSTEVILPLTEDGECCWIYIDECTEVGDGLRSGAINVSYGAFDGTTFTPANNSKFPDVKYLISQRKLFQVKGGESGKFYNIEYHEEYLHNYDSDESYGQTKYEGMPWGLDGVQLSYDNDALYFDATQGWIQTLINALKKYLVGVNPQYDFYIPSHDTNVSDQANKRDYRGYVFSYEIIQDVNGYNNRDTDPNNNIDVLALNEEPNSAIEYCFNKNKRNAYGQVVWETERGQYDQSQLNWYLPAIDEIEDIVVSNYNAPDGNDYPTYARFSDFQAKYYWSSQPSYIRNHAVYRGFSDTFRGKYYYDDLGYARATSVTYNMDAPEGEKYKSAKSGFTSDYHAVEIYVGIWERTHTEGQFDGVALGNLDRESGSRPRNSMARVRCVRKSEYTNTNVN